jgi:hypothetical protein
MVEHPARAATVPVPAAPMFMVSVVVILVVMAFVVPATPEIAALEQSPAEEAAMLMI